MTSESAVERIPISLGIYSSFPAIIHGDAILTYVVSLKVLQECIVQAISKMNMEKVETTLSVADRSGYFPGETRFELRIAEGSSFRTLNPPTMRRIVEYLRDRGEFSAFDHSLTVRYRIKDDMRHSLHCDKYVVRHLFFEGQMEIQLFHERGIRRLNPDEVIVILVKRINEELGRRNERQLKIEKIRTV
jgi:hypothetical protein